MSRHRAIRTYGWNRTPEQRAWLALKNRCLNPRTEDFKHYGARGLKVSAAWVRDFKAFLKDVGPRPGPGFTLERRDNSKGYNAKNCFWASRKVQARNRRSTKLSSVKILKIKTLRKRGATFQQIALKMNVARTTVARAYKGVSWR